MIFYHEAFMRHETPPGHPERPERMEACRRELEENGLWTSVVEPSMPDIGLVEEVHRPSYVEEVRRTCREGGRLDPDTVCGDGSFEAALLAVGAAKELAEAGVRGENGFGLVRPPGHHASSSRGMGFCLFNSAAVCAHRGLQEVDRVAIVDFDVHHGNGTQEIFYEDSRILYCSVHRENFYPGTGSIEETGEGAGEGFTVNLPIPAGSGDADLAAVAREVFLPVLESFDPGFLVVSAGFDAHERDPLGGLEATEEGFGSVVCDLVSVAPTVAMLEGGYDLEGLSRSVRASVEALRGERSYEVEGEASGEVLARIERLKEREIPGYG